VRTRSSLRGGFALHEVMVAVLVLGLALIPMLRSLTRMPELASATAEQGRLESWRSVMDQAVALGIDPVQTGLAMDLPGTHAAPLVAPALARCAVHSASTRQYSVRITSLSDAFVSTAEHRVVSAGFEVGPALSSSPPVRANPLSPLPPLKMSQPRIVAPTSPTVAVTDLRDTGVAGAPYVTTLAATGSDQVHLRQTSPVTQTAAGASSASMPLDAVSLALGVQGIAWAEYAGNPSLDLAVVLSDLRTRWIVQRGGRRQVIEPSDPVPFSFGIGLGRPIYRVGTQEFPSGDRVEVDIAMALAVERGDISTRIDYPDATKRVFGAQWPTIEPTYTWSFGLAPGNSANGDTHAVYTSSGRAGWAPTQLLQATPSVAANGITTWAGTWRVERRLTNLSPPERIGSYYDAALDAPGSVDFSAPILSSANIRLGNPEIDGVRSTTETLSVQLVP
jgi:Tfp pilus assembly protein PilV